MVHHAIYCKKTSKFQNPQLQTHSLSWRSPNFYSRPEEDLLADAINEGPLGEKMYVESFGSYMSLQTQ